MNFVMLSKRRGGCFRVGSPPKSEIDRNSDENDYQPWESGRRTIHEENRENHSGAQKIERRHYGITPIAVGTLGVGAQAAQPEHSRDGEDVEQQSGGNHVVQQIAEEIAERTSGGIVGADQYQEAGPEALHHQRSARNMSAI